MSYDGEKHYCAKCKRQHKEWGWIKHNEKFYCRKYMWCAGCQKIHESTPYARTMTNPETKKTEWYCQKWARPKIATPEEKAKNMSPEEVLSGVHMGMDRVPEMENDSEDYQVEHAREIDFLDERLESI